MSSPIIPVPESNDWYGWASWVDGEVREEDWSPIATRGRMHVPPWNGGTTGGLAIAAGNSYGIPVYLPKGVVSRLAIPSTGGTNTPGTARLGLGRLDRVTPQNSPVLLDAGSVDVGNAGAAAGIVTNFPVEAGWYLLLVAVHVAHNMTTLQNGFGSAATPFAVGSSPVPSYGYVGAAGVTGAFGATLGGTGTGTNVVPIVAVEMAP